MRRLTHIVFGLAYFGLLYNMLDGRPLGPQLLTGVSILVIAGSIFPDIDLKLGIAHRNPLTHSSLLPILLLLTLGRTGLYELDLLTYAFCTGVSSHLAGDYIKQGPMAGLPAKARGPWLLINAVLSVPWFTSRLVGALG